jgi:hypothetical protein
VNLKGLGWRKEKEIWVESIVMGDKLGYRATLGVFFNIVKK